MAFLRCFFRSWKEDGIAFICFVQRSTCLVCVLVSNLICTDNCGIQWLASPFYYTIISCAYPTHFSCARLINIAPKLTLGDEVEYIWKAPRNITKYVTRCGYLASSLISSSGICSCLIVTWYLLSFVSACGVCRV